MAKFNLFIITNQTCCREVYLPNKTPTSLASGILFETGNDNSSVAQSGYYKTVNNLPWAINVVATIPYAREKEEFSQCCKKFSNRVSSSGVNYSNWYQNNSGYRITSKLY